MIIALLICSHSQSYAQLIPPPEGVVPPQEGALEPGASPDEVESALRTYTASALRYLIAFGFMYAVVMAPYIAYLRASGIPDNLKKSNDLLTSLVYGLLMLALSSSIVTIVGVDILQI